MQNDALVAALIDVMGGRASLYGHSSGAGLVLRAVAAGLPVESFVLHDPPYSPDDEASRAEARSFAAEIERLLAEGRRDAALEAFYLSAGMPEEMIDGLEESPMWPGLIALAPTLAYDSQVMGNAETGGTIPAGLAARATQPGLVLVGSDSPLFMIDVSRRLAELLPSGRHQVLEGQDHVADPEVLAPIVKESLRP